MHFHCNFTAHICSVSICTWSLKSLVLQNWFLNLIFELDFLLVSNFIFTACLPCKNPVWNRQNIYFKNQFRELEVSKIKCRQIGGLSKKSWKMLFFKLIHTLVILKQNNLRSKFDKKFKVKKFVKGQLISKCPFGVFKSPQKK